MTSTAADTVNDSYGMKLCDNKGLARICRLCNIEQKSQALICHYLAFLIARSSQLCDSWDAKRKPG